MVQTSHLTISDYVVKLVDNHHLEFLLNYLDCQPFKGYGECESYLVVQAVHYSQQLSLVFLSLCGRTIAHHSGFFYKIDPK